MRALTIGLAFALAGAASSAPALSAGQGHALLDASDGRSGDVVRTKVCIGGEVYRRTGECIMPDLYVPFIPGNDYDTTVVHISNVRGSGDIASAKVNFTTFGEPVALEIHFVRTTAGWRAADILYPGNETGFRSDVFKLLAAQRPGTG